MANQLPLPLSPHPAYSRADFIVSRANAQAVAFVDAWPDWPVPAAAIYGPAGCGKSHLAAIWRTRADAALLAPPAFALGPRDRPLVVEGVDSAEPTPERDRMLFQVLEGATATAPVLLTGRDPPTAWPSRLPDLGSRFAALAAFPLWAPDEDLLAQLARKLFADRQLAVPEAVIARMLRFLERSPGAFRDFVDRADARALAERRPVALSLVRDLLAEEEHARAMTDSPDSGRLQVT